MDSEVQQPEKYFDEQVKWIQAGDRDAKHSFLVKYPTNIMINVPLRGETIAINVVSGLISLHELQNNV